MVRLGRGMHKWVGPEAPVTLLPSDTIAGREARASIYPQ